MADSLVLNGVKDVRKQTGTEFKLQRPKKGGDTFQLKRWWIKGGVSTAYTTASVFNVTTDDGTVKLAVESSPGSTVKIIHSGNFNFTFTDFTGVNRIALYNDAFQLIEHYTFPAISGGKIMTTTPPGGATRPSAVTFTGQGTLSGTFEEGEVITWTAATYSGGTGTVTEQLIIQKSDTGTSGWSSLSNVTSASNYVLLNADVGKYLRLSTKVTDDSGVTTSNSVTYGPVAAASPP